MNEPEQCTSNVVHTCTHCGQPILRFARYWRWETPDGEERMHPECYTARAEGLTKKVAS